MFRGGVGGIVVFFWLRIFWLNFMINCCLLKVSWMMRSLRVVRFFFLLFSLFFVLIRFIIFWVRFVVLLINLVCCGLLLLCCFLRICCDWWMSLVVMVILLCVVSCFNFWRLMLIGVLGGMFMEILSEFSDCFNWL